MTDYTWAQCGTTSDFSLKTDQAGGARILASNTLIGQTVTSISGQLKNPSSISGTSVLKCYSTGDVLKATSDTINNTSITVGYGTVTFSNFSWTVVADDYFLVSTDTGSTMRILMSTNDPVCSAYTNAMEDKGTPADIPSYDWIGTAVYGVEPVVAPTFLTPPIAVVHL